MSMHIQPSVPGNIGDTLMSTASPKIKENSVSSATKYENLGQAGDAVLNKMAHMSRNVTVNIGDTHGKKGLSAFGQILKNIFHNIGVLFAGNAGKARAELENSVATLENSLSARISVGDGNTVQALYAAVAKAKAEYIEKSTPEKVFGENSFESRLFGFAQSADSLLLARNENERRTDKPFERLVLKAFAAFPGDTEAVKEIENELKLLLLCNNCKTYVNQEIQGELVSYLKGKLESEPTTLADRIGTALAKIAANSEYALKFPLLKEFEADSPF